MQTWIDWIIFCVAIFGGALFVVALLSELSDILERDSKDGDE